MVVSCGDRLDLDDFLITYDDELVAHVDYEQKKEVLTIPDFIAPVQYPSFYRDALKTLAICKEAVEVLERVYANSSEILGKYISVNFPLIRLRFWTYNTFVVFFF